MGIGFLRNHLLSLFANESFSSLICSLPVSYVSYDRAVRDRNRESRSMTKDASLEDLKGLQPLRERSFLRGRDVRLEHSVVRRPALNLTRPLRGPVHQ